MYIHAACEGLVAHSHALLAEHGLHWFEPLWEHGYHPNRVALDRGFLRPLVIASDSPLARHPALFRMSPVVIRLDTRLHGTPASTTWRATRLAASGREAEVTVRVAEREPEARLLLQRELEILSRFTHPHLARILDVGQDAHGPVLVLPPLGDMVAAPTVAVPPAQAARFGAQLAGAIADAHAAGVVHGWIERAVIRVGPDGPVLDSFAEAQCDLEPIAIDYGSWNPRTWRYLSPEQVRGHPHDHTADVWAIAMLVAEQALGRHPTAGRSSQMDSLMAIRDLSFARVPPSTPLGRVLDQVFVAEPARRPSARQLADALALVAAR